MDERGRLLRMVETSVGCVQPSISCYESAVDVYFWDCL